MASDATLPPKRAGTRAYHQLRPLDPNPAIPAAPVNADAYRLDPAAAAPFHPPEPPHTPPIFSHSQPHLRQPRQSQADKVAAKFAAMEEIMKGSSFDSVGDFLAIMFYNTPRGEANPRGTTHTLAVVQFLRGRTTIKMSDVLPLIYNHRASFPSAKSSDVHEQKEMFATTGVVNQSNHRNSALMKFMLSEFFCLRVDFPFRG